MGCTHDHILARLSLGKTCEVQIKIFAHMGQWIMATFASCPASYYWVKVSILFFYLRVFQLQARLRYIIYALFIYCTAYYWLAFGTIVGLCNYKNKTWDITVQMNCFADGPLVFAIGGLDIFADIMVLAFPVPMVLKLKVSWPQRIYLLFIFLFGITLVWQISTPKKR